jgi:tRNA A-37 threonylcarbamoyl transferase component Bud32
VLVQTKQNSKAKDVEVQQALQAKHNENEEATKDMWESFGEVYDMVIDPKLKEQEAEHQSCKAVKQSKKAWRRTQQECFPFFDTLKK